MAVALSYCLARYVLSVGVNVRYDWFVTCDSRVQLRRDSCENANPSYEDLTLAE